MTKKLYVATLKQLCRAHSHKVSMGKPYDITDLYTALRLLHVEQMRDPGYRAFDPLEQQVHLMVHSTHYRKHKVAFVELLNYQPHAAADALCWLYKREPQLRDFLGLSSDQLSQKIQQARFQPFIKKMVPENWPGSAPAHFLQFIESLQFWLYALYRSFQK
jgi:hypothetical protein